MATQKNLPLSNRSENLPRRPLATVMRTMGGGEKVR